MKELVHKTKNVKANVMERIGQYKLAVFVVLFALVGATVLFVIKAASPTASLEAESSTLSGNASLVSDASASGGQAIRFNAPTTPPPSSTKLTWAPPIGWQNYPVKNASSATSLNIIDGGGGDVLVKLPPSAPTGPITIRNCRNAVVMGGQINLLPSVKVNSADQRAFYVSNCTGTVHIEGVYINGDINGAEGDGVAIDSDNAIVVVQNVRMHKLYGGEDKSIHNHTDIIQPWGGVKELRVDRLTGTTNYQGFQINNDLGIIGAVIIKNTNVGDSGVPPVTSAGGYYVWLKCGSGTKYTFENTYVKPRSGHNLSRAIWGSSCGMQISTDGNTASFTHADVLGGTWIKGTPAAGDFVPNGAVGIGYVSPGYLSD